MPVKSLRHAATWCVVTYMGCRVGLKRGSKYGVTYNVTEPHKGHWGGGRCKWRCTFATTSHKSFAKSRRSFWFTSMHFQTSMEFLKRTIATEDTRPRERFIEFYFEFGLNCDVIKSELYLRERHLKRVLTVRENTRGKACPDLVAWVTFISNHLQCSGQLHGY